MAALYDVELNSLLDQLVPVRHFTRRPRPSDPRFDKDCRDAKRLTRRLERACTAASRRSAAAPATSAAATEAAAARTAWYSQRRVYRQLRHRKCTEFRRDKIQADQSDPRKLWKSVDVLLGRGRVPASSAVDVDTFNQFFSPTRSLRFACRLAVRHQRRLAMCGQAYRFMRSRRWRRMMSSKPFGDYHISPQLPILFRQPF